MGKNRLPCVVCGTLYKSGSFWLCSNCARQWNCYKIPYRDWPVWIKELIKIERRPVDKARYLNIEEVYISDQIIEEKFGSDEYEWRDGYIAPKSLYKQKFIRFFTLEELEPSYYETLNWRITRDEILLRDNHTCRECGSTENLNVHHLTYKNFRREKEEELVTLCRKCHAKIHGIEDD
jgi:hypothetical protein